MFSKKMRQACSLYRKNIRFAILLFVEIAAALAVFLFFYAQRSDVLQAQKFYRLFEGHNYYAINEKNDQSPDGIIYEVMLGDTDQAEEQTAPALIGYSGALGQELLKMLLPSQTSLASQENILHLWLPEDHFQGYTVGQLLSVDISWWETDADGNSYLKTQSYDAQVCGVYQGGQLIKGTMQVAQAVLLDNPELLDESSDICNYIYQGDRPSDNALDLSEQSTLLLNKLTEQEQLSGFLMVFLMVICLSGWLGFEVVFFTEQEKRVTIYQMCGGKSKDILSIYLLMHLQLIGFPLLVATAVILAIGSQVRWMSNGHTLLLLDVVLLLFFMLVTVLMLLKNMNGNLAQKVRQFL